MLNSCKIWQELTSDSSYLLWIIECEAGEIVEAGEKVLKHAKVCDDKPWLMIKDRGRLQNGDKYFCLEKYFCSAAVDLFSLW